jgi:hypothetical protein
MTTFFANNETDGDGVYHVHHSNCGVRPKSNYFIIEAQNMASAVSDILPHLAYENGLRRGLLGK